LIGIVLVSHGQLASELLRAAEIIVGKIENTVTVDIHPKMGMEEIHTAVEGAIRTVDAGKGVLLLSTCSEAPPPTSACRSSRLTMWRW